MVGDCGWCLLWFMFDLVIGLVNMLWFKLLFVFALIVLCLLCWFGCVNCLLSVLFGLFTLFACLACWLWCLHLLCYLFG